MIHDGMLPSQSPRVTNSEPTHDPLTHPKEAEVGMGSCTDRSAARFQEQGICTQDKGE